MPATKPTSPVPLPGHAGAERLHRLTLEMSLKPFKEMSDAYLRSKIRELLRLWHYMIVRCDGLCVMLWVADGSEILSWDGRPETEMEWAKYIGFANLENCHFLEKKGSNPLSSSPQKARLYTDHPPVLTYGKLKSIVAAIKEEIHKEYGIAAEVGATFDPGPEFSYSPFKYKLHPEINRAPTSQGYIPLKADYEVVCPWSVLRGDTAAYAAYPAGIPEGTPFGTFFGKQAKRFMEALGFDYIWFSNGFGYSYFPWTYKGANFDGERFGTGDYRELADRLLDFWERFKKECSYRVEVRGSNFSTGMEISKDCFPVDELYKRGYLEFPAPNSPWGYIDYNFGLELGGMLTRIAHTPSRHFPFRFYLDDPWFWQRCWRHGFERQPHEVYLPLSLSRAEADGSVTPADMLEILTVDNEEGGFDEQATLEAVSHLRRGFEERPDAVGPCTVLYPYAENVARAAADPAVHPRIFFNDWFIVNSINNGAPLSTVATTDTFKAWFAVGDSAGSGKAGGGTAGGGMGAAGSGAGRKPWQDTVIFCPTAPLDGETVDRLISLAEQGGKVLFFGPLDNPKLQDLFMVDQAEPLTGDFDLTLSLETDDAPGLPQNAGTPGAPKGQPVFGSRPLRHQSLVSAGGLAEQLRTAQDVAVTVRAVAVQGSQRRAYALTRKDQGWKGGTAGWIRGSLPFDTQGMSKLPKRIDPSYFDPSFLTRWMLQDFGLTLLTQGKAKGSKASIAMLHRHDNATILTGYQFDSTLRHRIALPQGIPLFVATSVSIEGGQGWYVFDKTFHKEARVFLKQDPSHTKDCVVGCRHAALMAPTERKNKTYSLEISGLVSAELRVYPPRWAMEDKVLEVGVRVQGAERKSDETSNFAMLPLEYGGDDPCLVIRNISGDVEISW